MPSARFSQWSEGPKFPQEVGTSLNGYLEAGGDGGIFVVGCLWIPYQVVPAGEHLEAECEVIILPFTRAALGVAGHPAGCTALLLCLLCVCCISPKEPWPEPILGTGSRDSEREMNHAGTWGKTDLIQGTFSPNQSPQWAHSVSWVVRSLWDTGHLIMFSAPKSDFLWLDLPTNFLEFFTLTEEHPFLMYLFLWREECIFFWYTIQ